MAHEVLLQSGRGGDPLGFLEQLARGNPRPGHARQGAQDIQRHFEGFVKRCRKRPDAEGPGLVAVVSFRDADKVEDDRLPSPDSARPRARRKGDAHALAA